jgi:3-(methylthio)propanoyl-CoA dehydrogenase
MSAGVNRYKTDLRELEFVLFEQFGFNELVGKAPFENWGVDEARAVLAETYRFSREVLGPLNGSGDREGCRLEGGQVYTPKGFKDAWNKLYESGFKTLSISTHMAARALRTACRHWWRRCCRARTPRSTCTRAWRTARPSCC